jgi:DNA-binding CsgD family transcriptional regulator
MAQMICDTAVPAENCEPKAPLGSLASALLDCLSTNSAILDKEGVIRITNQAWQMFAKIHNMANPEGVGINYLQVTESARGYSAEKAEEAAKAIRALLSGQEKECVIEYPCHDENQERWCRMRATLLMDFGSLRVALTHEDITAERHSATALQALKKELTVQKANLETVNTALNVLLKRREDDKKDLEEKVLSNVRELISPYLEKLKQTHLNSEQREYLAIIQANVQGVVAPFAYHLSSKFFNLTSREIGVANLVLEGRGTKEIADVLCISANAVEFHRKNIRKKLGIRNKRVSLRTRLLSLEPHCVYQQFNAWKRFETSGENE